MIVTIKLEKNWWFGVLIEIDIGIDEGEFTDPELVKKLREFQSKYQTKEFFDGSNLTTAENIREANALIDKIWALYGNK